METIPIAYDTLTDAISGLAKRGYTHDFSLDVEKECLVCKSMVVSLSPDDFQIDEIYRFEGQTDPDDEVILYAISSEKYQTKGIIVNAYGIYNDEANSKIVEKLQKSDNNKKAPIKRHEALKQFSRDHHFGLLLAWKIRQGLQLAIEPGRISNYVQFFFQNDLHAHFSEEENLLFSKLPEGDVVRRKAEADHKRIYTLVELLQSTPSDKNLLNEFADLLEAHIRFEERVLFNHLQNQLSESQLTDLLSTHNEKNRDIDTSWNDHFWEK
ncbi:MAG: hemerythrin domain-containing protein [Bacteroidetes bacterium]|nr:hemerythrin domain-containing protein [Bacteroidota bacterium]